jgi:hypothetical protein
MARDWFDHGASGYSQAHLIIGCVDNPLGRREIAKTITAFDGRIWALDSGNERHNGQVLIGNPPTSRNQDCWNQTRKNNPNHARR